MAQPKGSYQLTKTRFFKETGIAIGKISDGLWQHIDTNDTQEVQVGPQYKSKAEALADHENYLRSNWGLR